MLKYTTDTKLCKKVPNSLNGQFGRVTALGVAG